MLMNVNVTVKSVSEPSRFAKAGHAPYPPPSSRPTPASTRAPAADPRSRARSSRRAIVTLTPCPRGGSILYLCYASPCQTHLRILVKLTCLGTLLFGFTAGFSNRC